MRIFRTALSAGLLLAAPLAIGTVAVTAVPAAAQNAIDQFEVSFQSRETQRRAIISNAMNFSEEEAVAFWPIYDQYRLVAKGHQLRRLLMLRNLSENAVGMDREMGLAMLAGAFALDADQAAAKEEYLANVAPHFEGARHFRIFQLETKLDAIFRRGWTRQIPLVLTEEDEQMLQDGMAMDEAEEEAQPTGDFS